jgi:hypothetical protein
LDTLSDIREYLLTGLNYLEENYDDLSKYNPDNGWGHIDGVISIIRSLLKDAKIHPEASLNFSR